MLRKSALLSAFIVSVCAIPPTARADICFQYGTGGGVSVAVAAKVPAINNCSPVTLVEQVYGGRLGVGTGSICRSEEGSSRPTLVYQYTYNACSGPGGYFESATCRIDLDINGELPTKPSDQNSLCNGVYAGLMPNQSGPLKQFNDSTLKVWSCAGGPFVVPGGGSAQCFANRPRTRSDERPAFDAPAERRNRSD